MMNILKTKLKPKSKLPSAKSLKTARFSKASLLIFITIFAAIGGYMLLSGHAAGPSVWMSTTGNDSTCVRGDSSKPCFTFSKACSIAQPGDIIQVADGTYNAEKVVGCISSSPGITFQAQDAHQVYVAAPALSSDQALELANRSTADKWITLDGIDTYTFGIYGPMNGNSDWPIGDSHRASHITIKNMTIRNHSGTGADGSSSPFYADQTDYLTLEGIQIGPVCCNADAMDVYPTVSNVVMSKLYIHDISETCSDIPTSLWANCSSTSTPFGSNHIDCLQMVGGDTITLEYSRLTNCAAGTFMNGINRQQYKDLTLLGNVFQGHVLDLSGGGGATLGTPAYIGFIHIYFNDVPDGTNFQDWQQGGDYEIVGNIFGDQPSNYGACTVNSAVGNPTASFAVAKYNMFGGNVSNPCGDPTNINANASYVNESSRASGIDLHLNAGSPGINAIPSNFCTANPSYCPSTDIDGTTRPQDTAFDMGGYEVVPVANVWVSTIGNDATCVRGDNTKPCTTFNKAYSIAQCGDIIEVAAGNYADQSIGHDVTKDSCATNVTIKAFGTVSLSSINDGTLSAGGGNYVTFDGFTLTGTMDVASNTVGGTHNIIIQNFNGGNFYINGTSNVQLLNSDWGPCSSRGLCGNNKLDGNNTGTTIKGNTMHDFRIDNTSDHFECLMIQTGTGQNANITIDSNKFINCEDSADLQVEGPISGITIENNWFDAPFDGSSVGTTARSDRGIEFSESSGTISDLLIRYNSFEPGVYYVVEPNHSTTRIISNIIGADQSCAGNVVYDYNIRLVASGGAKCGTHDSLIGGGNSVGYVNPGPGLSMDLSLTTGSPAIGFVTATTSDYLLNYDINSITRTTPRAAGADEYTTGGGSCPAGDLNSDCHVTITDLSILLSSWGSTTNATCDLNSNGTVDIFDLSILLSHYGS